MTRTRIGIIILFAGGWNAGVAFGTPIHPRIAMVVLGVIGVAYLAITLTWPTDFQERQP